MAGLAPLIGEVLGVERLIEVVQDGLLHSVRIGDAIDFEVEDIVPFGIETGQPARLTGLFHPAGSELTAAEATRSQISAFGIEYEEVGPVVRVLVGRLEQLIASAHEPALDARGSLAPAFGAVRSRAGLIVLLFALAALGWWWTIDEMRGMDGGLWTELGTLGWFVGVWVDDGGDDAVGGANRGAVLDDDQASVPDRAARVHLGISRCVDERRRARFRRGNRGRRISGDVLSWDRAGRWVAGGTLLVAAAYELTPLKDVCLGKCRSPLGFLLGSWRAGRLGALQMGAKHGAWCVGCCWALMASLFALGVMSVVWMAVVAGIIAFEKLIPYRRVATYATATLLLVLGIVLLVAPMPFRA